MTLKSIGPRLNAVRLVAATLTGLLSAQCGSIAVMDGRVGDSAVITDLGVSDGSVTTNAAAGDAAAPANAAPADAAPADAAPAVLGSAQSFAVLGGQTVTNTGGSRIVGNLGVSPGVALTGFPPGTLTAGDLHLGNAVALQAQLDVGVAYNALKGAACTVNLTGQELSGLTLKPGVYCFASSAAITLATNLVLDAQGDPNAVFIFQIGSSFTAGNYTAVKLINGASACNVYWQVGSSATVGIGTAFVGNILAFSSVTLQTGASVAGRVLARNAAVAMDTNDVSFATCAVVPPTADLVITVTSGQSAAAPSSTFAYLVTVTNRGANSVQDVAVTTQLIAAGGPAPAPISWTCSATANAKCGEPSGAGNINTNVDLAVGSAAVFVVMVPVPAQAAGTLEYRAQVLPSTMVPDPDLTNNNATYTVSIAESSPDMSSGSPDMSSGSPDMSSGGPVDSASQFHGRISGGGLTCNATGVGSSTSAFSWVLMLVLGALARRRRPSARPATRVK